MFDFAGTAHRGGGPEKQDGARGASRQAPGQAGADWSLHGHGLHGQCFEHSALCQRADPGGRAPQEAATPPAQGAGGESWGTGTGARSRTEQDGGPADPQLYGDRRSSRPSQEAEHSAEALRPVHCPQEAGGGPERQHRLHGSGSGSGSGAQFQFRR